MAKRKPAATTSPVVTGDKPSTTQCPYCKVPCTSKPQGFFIWVSCPTPGCTFAVKEPRPGLARRVQQASDAEADFSAR